MHDIWNPWHGCKKKSEGCEHCYMYYLDRIHGADGSVIRRSESNFRYPLQKNRTGQYRIQSGEMLRVCMTSDFFLEEADPWRDDAWAIMAKRRDVKFFLLTKRPERVKDHLPQNWGDGWENVFFNVTAENQKRADERIPILLDLPFRHKGIMCAPFIGPVSIRSYLDTNQIELVTCDGENYDGARPCDFEWVKNLRKECVDHNVTFAFYGTGRRFIKDGKLYRIEKSGLASQQAYLSVMNYQGKPMQFRLFDPFGRLIPEEELYHPYFSRRCMNCSMRITCNGCTRCGRCSDHKPIK